jgi:hypothetical protein
VRRTSLGGGGEKGSVPAVGQEDERKHAAEEEKQNGEGDANAEANTETDAESHSVVVTTFVLLEGHNGGPGGVAHTLGEAAVELVVIVHGAGVGDCTKRDTTGQHMRVASA